MPNTNKYLSKLDRIVSTLPELLSNDTGWRSLYINYAYPYVERVWCQHDDIRIYLHLIHHAGNNEILFHHHPWPAAMLILEGEYIMGIGVASSESEAPSIASTFHLTAGSRYEMINKDCWHYVKPITETVLSIMITGLPWEGRDMKSNLQLKPLSQQRKMEIISSTNKSLLSLRAP